MGKNEVPVRVDCLSHYCLVLDFESFFFFFIKRPFRMDSLTDSTVLVLLDSPAATCRHTHKGWVGCCLGRERVGVSLCVLSTHLEAIQTQLFLQWKDKKKEEEEGGDGERPSGNE